MKRLQALIKSNKGLKVGKGFSVSEVKLANFKTNDIKKYKIPFDKRRKSFYNTNIKTLKSLVK